MGMEGFCNDTDRAGNVTEETLQQCHICHHVGFGEITWQSGII